MTYTDKKLSDLICRAKLISARSNSTNANFTNSTPWLKQKRNLFKKRKPEKCDQILGVDRLLAPFNKFHKKQTIVPSTKENMILSTPRSNLTPKERNYIVCSCSPRSSRYARLKKLATEAERSKKVFFINGKCKAIREALVARGWVEKIPTTRMDLSTIRDTKYNNDSDMHLALERLLLSNFVQKSVPYFVWGLKDGWDSENLIQNHKTIHNKFNSAALWSTKQGLCSSVRNNYWHYIEGVAEINSPRTYNTYDLGEKEEFDSDYKLTACTSLLKWVLSMVANDHPIFCEKGIVSIKVLVFALKRCKEYLYQKQNKDIDICCSHTTNNQWNAFFKKYYIIISKQGTFKADKDNKVPLYLGYAKHMIKAIHKYRPQLSCEGCYNIWIIKPAHCSRGRGIRLASKHAVLSDLLNQGKYVFQKYIEESMLIYETKFDVRQYYLVTSTMPLVIWMYQDCYLKFSSQKYNLKNYHESIHLTNNAVQRKYKNCTDRHPELPQQNMWSLNTFKEYLDKIGKKDVWDNVIYPGMKKSIVGIMLSCQESTSCWKNRFELYGCDFILDKDCKPWLIEINSGPDLNPTTKVTAEICPAVLSDVIKVVIDRAENPRASTGKFECIYRQNINMRHCGRTDNLIVQGSALPSNYFYRGNLEKKVSPLVDERKAIEKSKKKMKISQKVNYRNSVSAQKNKSDDRYTADGTPIISCEKISLFSMLSSPSSNNFRKGPTKHETKHSNVDMKSSDTKPVYRLGSIQSFHKLFDFSKLDEEDDDVDPSGNACDFFCSNPSETRNESLTDAVEAQPYDQEPNSGIEYKEHLIDIQTNDHVRELVLPSSIKGQLVNDLKTDSYKDHRDNVEKEEQDLLFNATEKIFSFLNRKHKEYILDELS